jgi:hypothetical protein
MGYRNPLLRLARAVARRQLRAWSANASSAAP